MREWNEEPTLIQKFYDQAIKRALKHPDITDYLRLGRQEISTDSLSAVMRTDYVLYEALGRDPDYERLWRIAQRFEWTRIDFRKAAADCHFDNFLPTAALLAVISSLFSVTTGMGYWGELVVLALITLVGVQTFHPPAGRENFVRQLWAAALYLRWARWSVEAHPRLFYWSFRDLSPQLVPLMRREITNLLGSEHDTLLVTRHHRGLIHANDPNFWVASRIELSLRHKIDQMDGGAIAICGPRGAGKSTLLRKACEGRLGKVRSKHQFSVIAQTPANYRPDEFLLSLFQQVCRQFLERCGQRTRGPFLMRIRPTGLRRRILSFVPRSIRLLLAVMLLAVGLTSWVRSTYHWANSDGKNKSDQWLGNIQDAYRTTWHEQPQLTRALFIILGLLLLFGAVAKPLIASRINRQFRQLIKDCHSYLHLLQYMQTTGTSLNPGLTPISSITFGVSRSTGASSRTLTYPELVQQFRELLARIGAYLRDNDNDRVFIGIDELDRLGSAEQARTFLAEIKAIFGIPNIYFLLSISEDVGAAFIRRGLPVRDITDSSLEDIVHVEPRTLEESRDLLQTRVPGFTDPFVALVHVLSGGIPRDLIRFTRKVIEIRHRTGATDLRTIASRLLLEEVAQTLSGFRVVLANQAHTEEWGSLLQSIHSSIERLTADPRRIDVRETILQELSGLSSGAPPSDDDLAVQWAELSVYAFFAETVTDVFVPRRSTDERGPNRLLGDTNRLKELAAARLELGLSASSARVALNNLRDLWQLNHVRPHASNINPESSSEDSRAPIMDPSSQDPVAPPGPTFVGSRTQRRRHVTHHLTRAEVQDLLRIGSFRLRRLNRQYPDFPQPHANPHSTFLESNELVWDDSAVYSWAAGTPRFQDRGAALLRPMPLDIQAGRWRASGQSPDGLAIDWETSIGVIRIVQTTGRGSASSVASSLSTTRDIHGIVTVCSLYGDMGFSGPALWAADTAQPYIEYEADWGHIAALVGQPLPWWPSLLRSPELIGNWRPESRTVTAQVPRDEDETTLRRTAQMSSLTEDSRTAVTDMADRIRNERIERTELDIGIFGGSRTGNPEPIPVIIAAKPDTRAHPLTEITDRVRLANGWREIARRREPDAASALRVALANDSSLLPFGPITEVSGNADIVNQWVGRLTRCEPTAGHIALVSTEHNATDEFFVDPLTEMPANRTSGGNSGSTAWRFFAPRSLPGDGELRSVTLFDSFWITTDAGLVFPAPCTPHEHLWWGDGWGDRPTEAAYVVGLLLDDLGAPLHSFQHWQLAAPGLVSLFNVGHRPETELTRATLLRARMSNDLSEQA